MTSRNSVLAAVLDVLLAGPHHDGELPANARVVFHLGRGHPLGGSHELRERLRIEPCLEHGLPRCGDGLADGQLAPGAGSPSTMGGNAISSLGVAPLRSTGPAQMMPSSSSPTDGDDLGELVTLAIYFSASDAQIDIRTNNSAPR